MRFAKGVVSKETVRNYLSTYLDKAPKTYNNQLDALRAFVSRFLRQPNIVYGFKKTHETEDYERVLPTKMQLRKGFHALTEDIERAVYLFYATTGLRRSEGLELRKEDVNRKLRCVKAKHDTRTKRAGVTFYNYECAEYIDKIWNGHEGEVLNLGPRAFLRIWDKASKAAGFRITPQVLRVWQATELGELGVPDRYVDVLQGRAPKSVLAKFYTGKDLLRLKRIYDKAGLRVLS